MKIGIYEQIINQLLEEKITTIDQNQFYIGERVIKKEEVAISMYLTSIFEQVLSDMVDTNEDEDEEDFFEDAQITHRDGYTLYIHTLDLNTDFDTIKKRLDSFVKRDGTTSNKTRQM